jgi:hypothetical protein
VIETAAEAGRRWNLKGVEALVGAWCDQVEPALLTGAQAAGAAERLAVMNRRLMAKQASMAARAAECNAYSSRARSPEEWLAKQNGTSRSEAKRALETARRMRSCPLAAEAFDRGDLSLAEADAVSSAAVVDPGSEAALVAKATASHDLAAVRDAADEVKRAARSAEDEAARVARLRAGRQWREFTTPDGHRGVDARFVPEDLAAVVPVINAFTEAQFEQGRRAGTRDSHEAYRADGVLAAFAAAGAAIGLTPDPTEPPPPGAHDASANDPTVRGDAPSGDTIGSFRLPAPAALPDRVNWSMCVIVDGIALKRSYAAPGEICEIPGIGPVSVAWARSLMDDAIVDVLVHDSVDIRAYASATRHTPRPVQLALMVRDRTCSVPGCRKRWRLEADHCDDFAKGGPTALANLNGLCNDHHDEKTHRGARLEVTGTERLWWPPPPPPGSPPSPEGSIPWRAPIGQHLSHWNLGQLPDHSGSGGDDGRLPFS